MLKLIEKYPKTAIVLIVLVMLGFNLDVLQVSIMEARNFITAREMITDGNWIFTTMNGEARYQKPPLPTWINAVFALVFGIKSIIAFRLPSIIFVAIIGVYTYLISSKIVSKTTHSFINALIIITSFYVIGITFEAPSDIFTHGFMIIGIYHLFLLFSKNENIIRHSLVAGLFIGCSILSKGPVSFYALLLPFLLAYGFSYKYKLTKRHVLWLIICLVIAIVVGGSWYFYIKTYDAETFNAITKKETGNWSSYNVRPFYYYWSFFTQSGLWTIPAFIGLLYPYLKTRVSNLKAYKFSLFWTLFAVILLSIIPEKKSRYLMPVLIPLAINTGFYIDYLIRKFKGLKDKKETFPVCFNFGLIAFIGILFPLIGFVISSSLSGRILVFFIFASIGLFSIGILILRNLKLKNIKNVFYLTIAFMVCAFLFALPLSKTQIDINYTPISTLQNELETKNLKLYSFGSISPEMIWQYGSKIPVLKSISEDLEFPKEKQFGLLSSELSETDKALFQKQYNMKYIKTYDLNISSEDSRSHKLRLQKDYYILTKR
jgi:4-amino-4-deoxy-L-arabinose transferase-like glycosyltransferase